MNIGNPSSKAIMHQNVSSAFPGQDVTAATTWQNWDISSMVGSKAVWVCITFTDGGVTVGIRTDGSADTPFLNASFGSHMWVKTSNAGIVEIYCSAINQGDFEVLAWLDNVT